MLNELYIQPLTARAKTSKAIVSEADLPKLFSNISLILQFNQKFLIDLEKRVSNWNDNSVRCCCLAPIVADV